METSPNRRSATGGPRRLRYGIVARRLVGSAILLSGTVIFATEVSSYTTRQANPPAATAAQAAATLALK